MSTSAVNKSLIFPYTAIVCVDCCWSLSTHGPQKDVYSYNITLKDKFWINLVTDSSPACFCWMAYVYVCMPDTTFNTKRIFIIDQFTGTGGTVTKEFKIFRSTENKEKGKINFTLMTILFTRVYGETLLNPNTALYL